MSVLDNVIVQLGSRESGNSYSAVGPQTKYGRALGKYQFMPGTLAGYSKMSPSEFLKSPEEQERVMRAFTQDNVNYGYKQDVLNDASSDAQVAAFARAAHLGGRGGAVRYFTTGYNPKDVLGTSIGDYANMAGGAGRDVMRGDSGTDKISTLSPTDTAPTPSTGYVPVISREELSAAWKKMIDPATLSEIDKRAQKKADVASGLALLGSLNNPNAGFEAARLSENVYNQEYNRALSHMGLPVEMGFKERDFEVLENKRRFAEEMNLYKLAMQTQLAAERNNIAAERAQGYVNYLNWKQNQPEKEKGLTPYQDKERNRYIQVTNSQGLQGTEFLTDEDKEYFGKKFEKAGSPFELASVKEELAVTISRAKQAKAAGTARPSPDGPSSSAPAPVPESPGRLYENWKAQQ